MSLSINERKEILFESFDLLKDDFGNNGEKLSEIIGKMVEIDPETALDMWEFILKENIEALDNEKGGVFWEGEVYSEDLIFNPMYEMKSRIGEIRLGEIIYKRQNLFEIVFKKSADIGYHQSEIIEGFLKLEKHKKAQEAIDLLFLNPHFKNKKISFVFENIINGIRDTSNRDTINLVKDWGERIENNEEKAKVKVSLLDLF